MLGDMLFFTGGSKISDRLIMWRTHGQFVHVEIDMGDGTSIGALTRGVTRHSTPANPLLIQTSRYLMTSLLPRGVDYLDRMLNRQYGWVDIVDNVLSLVMPNGPFLISSNAVDCSQLAVNFLIIAGYPVPLATIMHAELVSPNDIARFLMGAFPMLQEYVK